MSANKNANKRQRVDYFASSLFFFFFFVFSFLLWTYPFLLLLFDVIISNKCHFASWNKHAYATDLKQSVHCSSYHCRRSGFFCDGGTWESWNYFFCLLAYCFFVYPSLFSIENKRLEANEKKLKFLWRKLPRLQRVTGNCL